MQGVLQLSLLLLVASGALQVVAEDHKPTVKKLMSGRYVLTITEAESQKIISTFCSVKVIGDAVTIDYDSQNGKQQMKGVQSANRATFQLPSYGAVATGDILDGNRFSGSVIVYGEGRKHKTIGLVALIRVDEASNKESQAKPE